LPAFSALIMWMLSISYPPYNFFLILVLRTLCFGITLYFCWCKDTNKWAKRKINQHLFSFSSERLHRHTHTFRCENLLAKRKDRKVFVTSKFSNSECNKCLHFILLPKGEKCGVLSLRVWRCNAMLSREIIRLRVKFFAHYYEQRTVEQITVLIWGG
jgi:hypothetical protein